jgi:hypothetical protein
VGLRLRDREDRGRPPTGTTRSPAHPRVRTNMGRGEMPLLGSIVGALFTL